MIYFEVFVRFVALGKCSYSNVLKGFISLEFPFLKLIGSSFKIPIQSKSMAQQMEQWIKVAISFQIKIIKP